MSFQWPLALLALLAVPLAIFGYVLLERRRHRQAAAFATPALVPNLVGRSPGRLRHLPPAIPLVYLGCSILTYAAYAWDKRKARRDEWRTPESTLHLLDLLGGWPGGWIARRQFRHKTAKLSFRVIFWFCVALHLFVCGWIFATVPAEAEFARFVASVWHAANAAFQK